MRPLAVRQSERSQKQPTPASRRLAQLARWSDADKSLTLSALALSFVVDVDHFKRINDEHGHPAGGQVLVSDAEGARALAGRCRERVAGLRILWDGACLKVTVSLGVASVEHLLRLADEALYRAKANGRNRVQLAA